MFFFFNDTATTEIYTLSLHDALPIYGIISGLTRGADGTDVELRIEILDLQTHQDSEFGPAGQRRGIVRVFSDCLVCARDRKSTRLNSSHSQISYAVFCLKKKTKHFRRLVQRLAQALHRGVDAFVKGDDRVARAKPPAQVLARDELAGPLDEEREDPQTLS